MKSLILTEKPSVARELAKVLGQFRKQEGYLEGNEYLITWAIGHLVELAPPEDYSPQLKKWRLAALPILPGSFKLKVNLKTGKQYAVVRELLNRKDVEKIICATDAGREGELIFRYIYRHAQCKKPFVRLWLSETTAAAVRRGFTDLRPGEQFNCLAAAAEARSQADWLIGINATRAFTVKYDQLLTVGRVQTPTLALIVQREQEIKNFKSELYWQLIASFKNKNGQVYQGKWFKNEQDRFSSAEAAQDVLKKVVGQPGVVNGVEEKEVIEAPPLLFNLNDLQKESNQKYGLPASRTLNVAQELYETKKLITYPRTDSRHLTQDMAGTIPARLDALAGATEYAGFVAALARETINPGRRYVDDSKVTEHTALIPTAITPDLDKLTVDQRRIYDLVARRFLAIFLPAARYKQTRIETEATGETFLTTGKVELTPGWKSVYAPFERVNSTKKSRQEETADTLLPFLNKNEIVHTAKLEILEKKTRPPNSYTDASILAVMEGAGRLLDDRALKDAMQGHGLGTSATRAAIIERLIEVGYIKREKKNLIPTDKGETLINLVPGIIKDPALTGHWEKQLAEIEAGNVNAGEFMAGIIELTKSIVDLTGNQSTGNEQLISTMQAQSGESHISFNVDSLGTCPLCGREVVEKTRVYGCTGYKDGCTFFVWKQIAGKKISQPQAKKLLAKGRTNMLKGFTSKAGNKFNAILVLDEGKVKFRFD